MVLPFLRSSEDFPHGVPVSVRKVQIDERGLLPRPRLEAPIKARLCTAFITAQPIVEVEELHNIHVFIGAERHDPGFGASEFIAAESALVFGVVSHDDCVHTRLRRLHRLDSGVAAFSVVGLKVVRVGYLYRKSEPLASRLLDLNGDLVEA
ncbi:hypothetical protein [Dermabacter hominis]